jgi:hypothetical protein
MKKIKQFNLLFYILALTLAACVRTPEQAARKVKNLVERFPGIVDSKVVTKIKRDTIIKTVYIDRIIKDTAKATATYTAIDTILLNGGVDTLIIEKIRYKIQGQCTAENLLPGVAVDTLGVKLRIRYKGNEQIINLEAINSEITTEIETIGGNFLKFYDPPLTKNHWFWAFVAMCVISLLLLYMHITR